MITFTTKFTPHTGVPSGKLADAELHFTGGALDGLRLQGFAVWERSNGSRNVTMPARQYTMNGERRSFALLRPITDAHATIAIRDFILSAYAAFEAAQGDPSEPGHPNNPRSAY